MLTEQVYPFLTDYKKMGVGTEYSLIVRATHSIFNQACHPCVLENEVKEWIDSHLDYFKCFVTLFGRERDDDHATMFFRNDEDRILFKMRWL